MHLVLIGGGVEIVRVKKGAQVRITTRNPEALAAGHTMATT
jgi:hypothetical protein